MPNFNDCVTIIKSNIDRGVRQAIYLEGPPGGGKTAVAKAIEKDYEFDNVVYFYASLRDPVDLLGTPNNNGEVTRWVPPEEFYILREGRNLLVLDELSDATTPMQNGLCALIHEGKVNNVKLSDETFIIATGNRTTDKSGANRLVSKLRNRIMNLEYDVSIDQWADWAIDNDIDPVLVQFLRYRPNLLIDFDPTREINPTPRAWEKVNQIDTRLPSGLYFAAIRGWVNEGAAAEYTGFRKIYASLPDLDGIMMNPDKAEVPEDPAVMYALTGALAERANKDNFERITTYMERFPRPDFSVMLVNDAQKKKPEIKSTKAFVKWAVKYSQVLL